MHIKNDVPIFGGGYLNSTLFFSLGGVVWATSE